MADADPSINIPSLLTLAVVSFFFLRWFLSPRTSGDASSTGQRGAAGGRRIDPAQIEQVSQMFPQLNRRDIIWDLQRNGGSVAATTERVLTGRGLETPPPSFQPQIPAPSSTNTRTSTPTSRTPKPMAEDLISRYNLNSRVAPETPEMAPTVEDDSTIIRQQSAWSQNKTERQRLLQKRRDDMILAARKRMQQKDLAAQ